jgi:hypothetical protein
VDETIEEGYRLFYFFYVAKIDREYYKIGAENIEHI